jgi:hypothetical protein
MARFKIDSKLTLWMLYIVASGDYTPVAITLDHLSEGWSLMLYEQIIK